MYSAEKDGPSLSWDKPKVEDLIDFLTYYQHWEPSYIRQRMIPMLSTVYLREMVSTQNESSLLNDQYKFHSILRVKIRHGHPYYLVKWKRAGINTVIHSVSTEQTEVDQTQLSGSIESTDPLDEPDVPTILVDNGCWFLLTDENINLVQAAFPKEVNSFMEEKVRTIFYLFITIFYVVSCNIYSSNKVFLGRHVCSLYLFVNQEVLCP